jgi:hypothetical protein
MAYLEIEPVPGPEAFETTGRAAELSRAAIMLTAGAALAGDPGRLPALGPLALPAGLRRIRSDGPMPVQDAAAALDLDLSTHLTDRGLRIPDDTGAALTRRLVDDPSASTAAVLVEAGLHSESSVVRASAAVAALDTTGPRDDVLAVLVQEVGSRDRLARQVARTGLGRVAPQHAALRRLVRNPAVLPAVAAGPVAALGVGGAVVTHGTFAAATSWWKPGGGFYRYLAGLTPDLHLHDPSFGWSGQYSDGARQLAAQQLVEWTAGFGLTGPDLFAHSHGGTVAHLATRRGLVLDRLVLLSWPVHGEWFPDFTRVRRIIDIRVRLDLVVLADRGGQTFTPPAAFRAKVEPHVNGWFDHGATNDPAYWEKYQLSSAL